MIRTLQIKLTLLWDLSEILCVRHISRRSVEPQPIKKGARRFIVFDDKNIAMYARGMTVRDWQNQPLERL